MHTREDGANQVPAMVGVQQILKTLVQKSLDENPEIVSLALSDGQGLPIIDATDGRISVMAFTAMATMSIRTARTAAETVGLERPEHVTVHCPSGQLIIMDVPDTKASLIALLRTPANLGLALVMLRRLAIQLGTALQE